MVREILENLEILADELETTNRDCKNWYFSTKFESLKYFDSNLNFKDT